MRVTLTVGALALGGALTLGGTLTGAAAGIFSGHGDVGIVLHAGTVRYDAATGTYTVTGSGDNMWAATDAFQYVWTRVDRDADVTLAADVELLGAGGNAHRKAALMVRQSLDADAAYADVAVHGDGLAALQVRRARGAQTHEVIAPLSAPTRLRLEKSGDQFEMFVGARGGAAGFGGGAARLQLTVPFYVGLAVCAHDKDATQTATFRGVRLRLTPPGPADQGTRTSTLETVAIASTDRQAVYVTPGDIETPNWTGDGQALLFNRDGRLFRVPLAGGAPAQVASGDVIVNGDHGLSPDGGAVAISGTTVAGGESRVYVMPATGGTPRLVTSNEPSYFHGWSPDGKTIAFVGRRNGNFDVYTVATTGGAETRLTRAPGLDDGPEFAPDGRHIYFTSDRTGRVQLWRMQADGSSKEQLLADDRNDWFPHVSPDGKWLAYLSYRSDVQGHPADQPVQVRLLSLADRTVTVLARLTGGVGTLNENSWSPDSKHLAFVSYAQVPSAPAYP